MRKFLLLLLFFTYFGNLLEAATYRNFISQTLSGNTLTLWVNSDTALGENTDAELKYDLGGSTNYAWTAGSYNTSMSGANWQIVITIPSGATNISFQLANKNESGTRYGLTGFVFNVVLPVDLVSISLFSDTNKTKLSWQTASETNNDYFDVQYATDGLSFQNIGRVDGSGNSSTTVNYEFIHDEPSAGTSYYRLKQVDFDGKFEYSPIVSATLNGDEKIKIFPNPVQNILHLEGINSDTQLSISDYSGKILRRLNIVADGTVDISDLPKGMYIVSLIQNVTPTHFKMIKE